MDFIAFLSLLYSHLSLYCVIVVLNILFNLFLFRKYIYNVFDPLLFNVITSAFAGSVVYFLYFLGEIDVKYLYSYLITQGAFFLGFFSIRSSRGIKENYILHNSAWCHVTPLSEKNLFNTIYIVSFFVLTASKLITYIVVGVPLFMASRLEVFTTGSGLGILARLSNITQLIVVYGLFIRLLNIQNFRKNSIFFDVLIFFTVFVFMFLSGSKSSVVILVQMLFLAYVLFYSDEAIRVRGNAERKLLMAKKIRKYQVWLFIIAIGAAFSVIILRSSDSSDTALVELAGRIVGYGDVYIYAYTGSGIDEIPKENGLFALFSDFLGLSRLIDRSQIPSALGYQLLSAVTPLDVVMGPNARHNVFGYHYWGYLGGAMFSFSLGLLLSFVRNFIIRFIYNHILGGLFFVVLLISVFSSETDPAMMLVHLNDAFITLPLMLVLSFTVITFLQVDPLKYKPTEKVI